ncbi:hypothetical protein EDB83DRAFT_2322958 [Lactarius deliciosus]|nr:hypothetical protein EDB83DRAFT_2322958 [Lactarius deliciosus]
MASLGGQRGGSRTRNEDVKRVSTVTKFRRPSEVRPRNPSFSSSLSCQACSAPQSYKRSTELARKADTLILEDSHAIQRAGAGSVDEKNAVDLVTEYDVKVEAVEELARREIAGAYRHV